MERFARAMIRVTACAAVFVVAAGAPVAEEYRQFPGAPTDSRTLRIKERVEGIFLAGDYGRALLIYEKELAPLGDKYAQYMVGFMHLAGKGVPENRAEAYAWYRLAAERGEAPFIRARDELGGMLEAAEVRLAHARFAEIWQRYGDRRLILDLIESDLRVLRGDKAVVNGRQERGGRGHPIAAGYAENETGDGYSRRVRARLNERLRYLPSTMDAAEAGIENPSEIGELESKVQQELRRLDLR